MTPQIDNIDSRLLDLIQAGFPLVPRPYDALAERLELTADEVMSRIARLKRDGVIREISAIFHSAALGYRSALVALRVREDRLDDVGTRIASHAGVSHCYSRDAAYNLWFTITVPPAADLEAEITRLAAQDGVEARLILPALRTFKIGVFMPMADGKPSPGSQPSPAGPVELSPDDRAAIKVLQQDLPVTGSPFTDLARGSGLVEADLLERAKSLLDRGVMRRYAAVLRHVRAGYASNAMVCWRVPPADVAEAGEALAAHPSVSHCYERPTSPNWPYPLYTMVHARTGAELSVAIDELSRAADISDYTILRTLKEFRKSRVAYLLD